MSAHRSAAPTARTGWDAQRRARVAFARLTEPMHAGAAAEIVEYGHVGALERLVTGLSPLRGTVAARLRTLDVDAEERATALCGARVVIPGDEEWPTGLEDLEHPPHCLWVAGTGHLAALTARSVAVVGARAATDYGQHVAGELGYGLVAYGVTPVSGGAFGIDAAAHRGALAADGATVAALACGIDRAYPAAHTGLLEQIRAGGCVVTEVPPGSAPLKSRFLERNRIIAAMSSGTVVVEAGLRSGSLNTAGWAQRCARPVGAVPGPVTSAASAGTNQWIREHRAELVCDAGEVVELVGDLGADLAPAKTGPPRPEDELADRERRVWEALPVNGAADQDRLAAAAGLSAGEVAAALGTLHALGWVEPDGAAWGRTTRK